MKLDRHIKVDEELHNKILLLSKESKLSYSDEVSLLVEEALSNRIKQTQLDKMQNDADQATFSLHYHSENRDQRNTPSE